MKTLKHVFAVILTVALLFGLMSTAFAAGSITVMDPGTHTYKAYKIFDVTADSSGNLTYTAADPWKTAIIDAIAAGEVEGLQIDATSGAVTKLATFKAADFAKWAKNNIPTGATSTTLTADASGKVNSGDLAAGYYLVLPYANDTATTPDGDLASLCTVLNAEVAIQNKNDMPFDKVVVEGANELKESDVQVGDTLNFKITGKVPTIDTTTVNSYFYLVSDRLTAGLDLVENSISVAIGGTALSPQPTLITDPNAQLEGDQYRIVKDSTGRVIGFDLSLDMMTRQAQAGQTIEITYQATVNSNAVNKISENEATLDYGDENTQHHKDSETKHYTSKIVIDKYETGSPESKVPGAGFILYKLDGTTKYYYVQDSTTKAVTWSTTESNATVVVTSAEGAAEFPGLPDGTYYLHESTVPAGYTALTEDIEVVVDGSDSTAVGLTDAQIALALSEVVRVANTPGTLLPSTGGIGTTVFYVGGGLLVVAAIVVILLATRKKENKANN